MCRLGSWGMGEEGVFNLRYTADGTHVPERIHGDNKIEQYAQPFWPTINYADGKRVHGGYSRRHKNHVGHEYFGLLRRVSLSGKRTLGFPDIGDRLKNQTYSPSASVT